MAPADSDATTVQAEPRPRKGLMTRLAARAATETQPPIPEQPAPQEAGRIPSPIRAPPSPIRYPAPAQAPNQVPHNNYRGSRD